MKLMLVSDVHYRLKQYDWLFETAGDVDVIVMSGDLLDIRSAVPIGAQVAAVSAQLSRIATRTTLLAASGNHDLDDRDAAHEKTASWLQHVDVAALHVDGETVVIGSTLFTICGWWDGPSGRQALDGRLRSDARRAQRDGLGWVWVYHSPPKGSPLSWDGQREYGDQELADWIAEFRPDVVLTGHIHQSPFVDGGGWADRIGDTWVFNAGQQLGPTPARVVIDFDTRTATWFTATDREMVALTTG
jgi:Icc-related predicted phosphoesterase